MKLLVIIVTVFVGSCYAVGEDPCTWGPAYWCKNDASAKECSASEYCRLNVWNDKGSVSFTELSPASKKPSQSELCDLCNEVVAIIKPYVDNNATEPEIQALLENICKLMGTYNKTCSQYVSEYLPFIFALLKQGVDSGELCQELHLCNSTTQPKGAPGVNLCSICKLVTSILKSFVDSNSSEEEAEKALESVCSLLPGNYSSECKKLVDEYFPTIWMLVKAEVDSGTICVLLRLCNSTSGIPPIHSPKAPQADLCELCKQVVTFLRPFVDSNATEEEAKAALDELCSLIPTVGAECKMLVDTYFPVIWKLVQQEIDSGELCTVIGLCPKPNSSKMAATRKYKQAPDADLCQLCELATQFLKAYVDNNNTEAEALAALEKVCGLLPSTFSQECDAFVKEYFPLIWKFLQQEIDSDQLCKLIGLCPSSATKPKKSPQADLCDDCKRVVNFLKPFVDSNATEEEAKAAVEEFCKLIPSIGKTLCDLIVDRYFKDIWKLLQAEVDTDKICQQLHLCPGSMGMTATRRPVAGAGSEPDDIECDICMLILKYAEAYLAKNATEAQIEAFLDKVCDLFPIGKSECENIVKEYLPELISFIESEESPQRACELIDFCSQMEAAAAKPQGVVECDLCTMVLKYVDAVLTKNASEAEVVALLDKVCHFFPAAIQKECVAFVDAYAKDIIPLIVQELDPEKICTMIGLCSKDWTNLQAVTGRV